MAARTGSSHPLGKFDERLDIPLPAELKERICAVALVNGKNSAEWVRDVLEKIVAGELAFMQLRMNGQQHRGDGTNRG